MRAASANQSGCAIGRSNRSNLYTDMLRHVELFENNFYFGVDHCPHSRVDKHQPHTHQDALESFETGAKQRSASPLEVQFHTIPINMKDIAARVTGYNGHVIFALVEGHFIRPRRCTQT